MTKLLILLVLVLGILAIAQLARVYELTSRLRGKREEEISPADNRMNANLMWIFMLAYFGFFLWLVVHYKDHMLPVAASEHGADTDALLNFNWAILIIAFVITNVLLFVFSYKYMYNKDRRAFWYPHNNKLELLWTVVPAAVLAVIIIYGLTTWNRITTPPGPGAVVVELYAKQFDWTARYPGSDGILGATDFRLINGNNPLGIVTPASIGERMKEIDQELADITEQLADAAMLPDSKVDELEERAERLRRTQARIVNLEQLMDLDIKEKGEASAYLHGADDVVTKEFHLPVHQEAQVLIRSRDVIHSAYIPHLRAQMNAVPGMTTQIKMTPTITTDSMRTIPEVIRQVEAINAIRQKQGKEPHTFDYLLLCNKICGASHYNMQMPLVVTTGGEFDSWYAEQQKKPFQAAPVAEKQENTTVAQSDTTVAAPLN
jgi:cytochrome c oxidase subunit 2